MEIYVFHLIKPPDFTVLKPPNNYYVYKCFHILLTFQLGLFSNLNRTVSRFPAGWSLGRLTKWNRNLRLICFLQFLLYCLEPSHGHSKQNHILKYIFKKFPPRKYFADYVINTNLTSPSVKWSKNFKSRKEEKFTLCLVFFYLVFQYLLKIRVRESFVML